MGCGLIPVLGFWLIPCAALLLEGLTHSRAAAFSTQGPFALSPKGLEAVCAALSGWCLAPLCSIEEMLCCTPLLSSVCVSLLQLCSLPELGETF